MSPKERKHTVGMNLEVATSQQLIERPELRKNGVTPAVSEGISVVLLTCLEKKPVGSVFSLPCGHGLGNTQRSWSRSSPILDPPEAQ